MSRRLALVGGPYDGADLAYRPGAFVTVYGRRERPRGSARPRREGSLYERRGDVLVWATGRFVACGCGAIRAREVPCLCGAGATAPAQARA